VQNLTVVFDIEEGPLTAVDDVSLTLMARRTLGLVGESGCGKSVTALAVMRLLPQPAGRLAAGRILLGEEDLARLPADRLHAVRGRRIAMIFQEPMTALNPVHSIGRQLAEVFHLHFPGMEEPAVRRSCLDLLQQVGIPAPEKRLGEYPHQISGGMRQRVMIAMALACRPEILIADEPTTALDVTIQAQILDLIRELQAAAGMAVIFITHDLGVVAEMCDDVAVMYAGKVVETAPIGELFANPRHPYTRGLLESIPRLELPRKQLLRVIPGTVPGLDALPPGCRFENRCAYAQPVCGTAHPPLVDVDPRHASACYFASALPPWKPPVAGGAP